LLSSFEHPDHLVNFVLDLTNLLLLLLVVVGVAPPEEALVVVEGIENYSIAILTRFLEFLVLTRRGIYTRTTRKQNSTKVIFEGYRLGNKSLVTYAQAEVGHHLIVSLGTSTQQKLKVMLRRSG
jgi:hypothetical protein